MGGVVQFDITTPSSLYEIYNPITGGDDSSGMNGNSHGLSP
jgi:hypothetical protein